MRALEMYTNAQNASAASVVAISAQRTNRSTGRTAVPNAAGLQFAPHIGPAQGNARQCSAFQPDRPCGLRPILSLRRSQVSAVCGLTNSTAMSGCLSRIASSIRLTQVSISLVVNASSNSTLSAATICCGPSCTVITPLAVSYTHLRAHETPEHLV